MSEDLVVPVTGELIPLAEPARVAAALADVRELKRQLDDARRILEEALVDEAQRQGTRTLRYPGLEVKVGADRKLVWDVPKLNELRDAGLPEDRLDELLRPVVEYKVDGRVARQLAGANEDYARIIDEAKVYEPKPRYVAVDRAPTAEGPEQVLPAATGPEHAG